MGDTKLIYRVINNKSSSKLGTRTSLKIVIIKCDTIRTRLYNSTVYTATKVN